MVSIMAGFHIFFALFWPLASVLGAFATRIKVNEEGTNYLAASFGSIGPIFTAVVCVPFFAGFLIVAWGAFTQRDWGYHGSFGVLGLFGVLALMKFGSAPALTLFWLVLVVTGVVFWLKSDVKAWYGLD
jgi:MFS family permease